MAARKNTKEADVIKPNDQESRSYERTSVPAAARAMAMFEIFSRERRELSKSELARLMYLPESSCSDLLNTLYELGYVSRSSLTKRYYPTGRLLSTATLISRNDPLNLIGVEAATLLSRRVRETCTFGVLDNNEVKILAVSEGAHRLRYTVSIGDRVSLHGTALGKALLSLLPSNERSRLLRIQPLRRLTDQTQTDPSALEREIAEGIAEGTFHSRGEGGSGVWSLAIGAYIGTLPVGLSIIGPADRIKGGEADFITALKDLRATVFENGPIDVADGQRPRGRLRRS